MAVTWEHPVGGIFQGAGSVPSLAAVLRTWLDDLTTEQLRDCTPSERRLLRRLEAAVVAYETGRRVLAEE